MSIRKCHKCGKTKKCRYSPSCYKSSQPICNTCNRQHYAEWYADPENHERKLEYQRQHYRGVRLGRDKKRRIEL